MLCSGSCINYFGIVVEGILRAERYTCKGCNLCSTYFENNDIFPEFLYFTGSREYSLVAVKKTKLAWIPVEIFEKLLEDPDMMYSFMLYISKRSLKNHLLLNCLSYRLIRERIAYWIVGLNDLSKNNNIITLPQSQTIWANLLHVSRSSLNQELKLMEEEGYFRITNHTLTILDMDKLNSIL